MPVTPTTTPTPDAALVGALVSLMLRHVRAALPVAAGAVVDRLGADAAKVATPTAPATAPPPRKRGPRPKKAKRPGAPFRPDRPAGSPGPTTPAAKAEAPPPAAVC